MVKEFQPVVAEDRPPSSDGTQCILELQSHPQEVVELQQFTSVNLGLDSPNLALWQVVCDHVGDQCKSPIEWISIYVNVIVSSFWR
jgi:hypothetical protein